MQDKITPEMARKALISRGIINDSERDQSSDITPDMARQSLISRGVIKNPSSSDNQSLLSQYIEAQKNYLKGGLRGGGQALGDIGASIGNFGIDQLNRTGLNIPHIPHPDLINKNPQSLSESLGQNISQNLTPLLLPVGPELKALKYGKNALQKLLGSMGTGGAIGYVSNEDNRLGSGLIGAAAGAIPAASNIIRETNPKKIASSIMDRFTSLKKDYGKEFTDIIKSGEESGANKFLKKEKANFSLLEQSKPASERGEKDLLYTLNKYNKNPTLENAHKAQGDLEKYSFRLKNSQGDKAFDARNEAKKIADRLRQQIHDSLNAQGPSQLSNRYKEARKGYGKEVGPYLKSDPIYDYSKGDLRPKDFTKKILEDKKFIARVGENHPELLRKEMIESLKKNKIAQGVATGASIYAGSYLPHSIATLLGMKK